MTADPPSEDASRRRRRGERSAASTPPPRAAQPQRPFAPVDLISRRRTESIHRAALTVLQEIGLDFLHDGAKAILKDAGADVDPASKRVRFDPALVEAQIGLAPQQFTLHARNPERNVAHRRRGTSPSVRSASAPNAFDRAGGRRPGNDRRLSQFPPARARRFDSIHFWGGYPVEPVDMHASVRHLDALFDMLTLSDKPIHAYSLGRERNLRRDRDGEIARGDRRRDARARTVAVHRSSIRPRRCGSTRRCWRAIIQMARRNQVVVLTPFTLAGAMAPVTLAGALAQQHAEALAGYVTRPTRPAGLALRLRRLHLQRRHEVGRARLRHARIHEDGDHRRTIGAPARACPIVRPTPTPPIRSTRRRLTRACFRCGARSWAASIFLMHGAGWMEGGLQASFEKMALDADLLAMVAEFLKPVRVDEAELALDAMREVGPGGHFFGAAHTQSRYRNAFFAPMISDWRNYESWREAGAPTAFDAAERIYKERLRTYAPPDFEPERREALAAFVARRKAEGGAPTDF